MRIKRLRASGGAVSVSCAACCCCSATTGGEDRGDERLRASSEGRRQAEGRWATRESSRPGMDEKREERDRDESERGRKVRLDQAACVAHAVIPYKLAEEKRMVENEREREKKGKEEGREEMMGNALFEYSL